MNTIFAYTDDKRPTILVLERKRRDNINIYTDMKPIIVDTLKDYHIHSVCGSSRIPLIHTEDGKIYTRGSKHWFGGRGQYYFLLLLKALSMSSNCL